MKSFTDYFERMTDGKYDFNLRKDGTCMVIEHNGSEWKFVSYSGVAGKGFHLCGSFKRDVDNFIKASPEYLLNPNHASSDVVFEVQKANMVGLMKYRGCQVYNVDINNCYWETAYKMGFMSQKTYANGLKTKRWKDGRNASIGALVKTTVVSKYKNGKLASSEIEKGEIDFSPIRNNIISHVHGLFLGLLKQLGDDWLMYLTDCVYVPYDKITEVQEYFKALGYQSKVETYQLDGVNEKTGLVNWFDYQKNAAKAFQFKENQRTLEPRNFLEAVTVVKQVKNQPRLNDNTDFLNQPPC